jgi:hypothetical protein
MNDDKNFNTSYFVIEQTLYQRSFRELLRILKEDLYGVSKRATRILDISNDDSSLHSDLVKHGIRVERLRVGFDVWEPLELILLDGSIHQDVDLNELLSTFKPGFQLIVMNTPIRRNRHMPIGWFDPSEYGLFKLYELTKWYDVFQSKSIRQAMAMHPIVKISVI